MGKKSLSIDIGKRKIKILESISSKNEFRILNKIVLDTPDEAYSDGELINLIAIADSVQEALKRSKIRCKKVHMNINSTNIITKEIEIPITKEENIRGIVNREIEGYIPVDFDSYAVEYKVISSNKSHYRVIIVVFQKSIIKNYYELCKTMGLKGIDLDINANIISCVLNHCESINGDKNIEDGIIAIEVGEESITFSGFEGKEFGFTRNIEGGFSEIFKVFGGEDLNKKSIEEEILNHDFSEETPGVYSLERELNRCVTAWCLEIERLQSYYINTLKKDVKKVYLYGGRSKLKGLRGILQKTIGLPVEVIEDIAICGSEISVSEDDILNNIGMGLKGNMEAQKINFYREIHENNRRTRKIERIVSGIVGVTVVVGIGVVGYWKFEIESERDKIEGFEKILNSKITKVKEEKINGIELENEGVQKLLEEMKLIEIYANKRDLDYSGGINDILMALPEGVKVTMFSYREGVFSVRCYGTRVEQVYEAVGNLKAIGSDEVTFSDIVLSKEKEENRITFELSGILIKEDALVD